MEVRDAVKKFCSLPHLFLPKDEFSGLQASYYSANIIVQARVVRKVDNAIHRINHYPVDSVVCFVNTCPRDSDLSGPGCSKGG